MNNETKQIIVFLIFCGFAMFMIKSCIKEERLIKTACSEPTSQACTNLTKEEK